MNIKRVETKLLNDTRGEIKHLAEAIRKTTGIVNSGSIDSGDRKFLLDSLRAARKDDIDAIRNTLRKEHSTSGEANKDAKQEEGAEKYILRRLNQHIEVIDALSNLGEVRGLLHQLGITYNAVEQLLGLEQSDLKHFRPY